MAIDNVLENEGELILEAQNDNSSAFAKLYDFYIKQIYNFVYYKTLNKEVAEDITSEVFLKAWRKIKGYRDKSLSAWLYKIARNSVIDYYRSHREHKDIEDAWDLADGDDFIAKIDGNLKIEKIKDTMTSLKGIERDIIIMRFWQDMTFSEISLHLGKNEGAVKMSLKRALLKIKQDVVYFIFLAPEIITICKKIN